MYVWTSVKAIKTQIFEHKSSILKNEVLETSVVIHFLEKQHGFKYFNLAKYIPYCFDKTEVYKVLLKLEAEWIFKLKTYPIGLKKLIFQYLFS